MNNQFDKKFRDSLQNLELDYRDGDWDKMESLLNERRRFKYSIFYWGAGVFVLALIGGLFYLNHSSENASQPEELVQLQSNTEPSGLGEKIELQDFQLSGDSKETKLLGMNINPIENNSNRSLLQPNTQLNFSVTNRMKLDLNSSEFNFKMNRLKLNSILKNSDLSGFAEENENILAQNVSSTLTKSEIKIDDDQNSTELVPVDKIEELVSETILDEEEIDSSNPIVLDVSAKENEKSIVADEKNESSGRKSKPIQGKRKIRNLNLNIFFSPEWNNYVTHYDEEKLSISGVSFNGGCTFEKPINDWLSMQAGVSATFRKYSSSILENEPTTFAVPQNTEMIALEIPIWAKVYFVKEYRFNIFGQLGYSFNPILSQKYLINDGKTNVKSSLLGGYEVDGPLANNFQAPSNFYGSILVGLGTEVDLLNGDQFYIMPIVKEPLNEVGLTKDLIHTVNLQIGYKKKF